jgi:two-component system sensor histidine kinase PilS (NtrC family)
MIEPTEIQITPPLPRHTPQPDWSLLHLFNLYRLSIVIVFFSSWMVGLAPNFLGAHNKFLFLSICLLYLLFGLISIATIQYHLLLFRVQVLEQVMVDILAITLLMHASGGASSGIGMLLVITIAGGSLLTEGRTAFFFAAVASLSILIQVTLSDFYEWFPNTNYTQAGILGMSFFATAYLAFTLAHRIRVTEALARQRGVHLRYFSELNEQIVQHIQSGILVIDAVGRIRLFNDAAKRLLGLNNNALYPNLLEQKLNMVAPVLADLVSQWRRGEKRSSLLFRPANGEVDVIPTFKRLNRNGVINILVLLEDAMVIAQQAQLVKLAALGRLTASIAHEIRNPLNSISYAGQLLAELDYLTPDDKHLTEIMVRNCQRVNDIIESVLQLGRSHRSLSGELTQFKLYDWLQDFVTDLRVQHNLQLQDIEIYSQSLQATVRFDPVQLYQVLGNLSENGLRYSRATPLLKFVIGGLAESNSVYLDICDRGLGMQPDIAEHIFEPFFTTESMGTGLGLYIAKEICEANDATLQLVQNSEAGCCFRIHFLGTELISL